MAKLRRLSESTVPKLLWVVVGKAVFSFGLATLAWAVVILPGPATASAELIYTLVPIPDLPGSGSFIPADINALGDVVGRSSSATAGRFDFASGLTIDRDVANAYQLGMNDAGYSAGRHQVPFVGFYFDGDTAGDCHTPASWPAESYGYDINNSNVVVGGRSSTSTQPMWTYDADTGIYSAHGTLANRGTQGNAINEAGDVAGSANISSDWRYKRAFFWDSTTEAYTRIDSPYGPQEPYSSHGMDVNENEEVLLKAYAATTGNQQAFIWAKATGMLTDLGKVSAGSSEHKPYAFNSDRLAVGEYWVPNAWYPWVYDPVNGMRNLNSLDVTFVSSGFGSDITSLGVATGVNEQGWITGYTKFSRDGGPSNHGHGWILILEGTGATHDRGDLNCDREVGPDDIGPFVLALINPDGYVDAWPDCDVNLADMNYDQAVDGADIAAFAAAVLEWTPPPTGACCLQDSSCTEATEVDCGSIHSGIYQGDGMDCAPTPCVGAPVVITNAEFFPDLVANCPGNEVQLVIVTGSGFVDGATMILRNVGQPMLTIPPLETFFYSETYMEAWFFEVGGAQTGTWEVILTNPDTGFAIAPQMLEIEQCP